VAAPITVAPEPAAISRQKNTHRWDGTDLATISGSYGDYLLNKVSKVFPRLKEEVL
jgi:hypothetical protein